MNKCLWCGKPVNNLFCNTTCQLNHEYNVGIRDKNKIIEKGRKISNEKLKKDNWLNYKSSRDKLRKIMKTDEYKLKARKVKLGNKNPMFGKKPWNWIGIDKRDKYGNADRGFDWKKIKKIVKERDNYTCQICGITEKDTKQYLQVHHLIKYSIFKDNDLDNLITLCPKCHANSETQFLKVNSINKIIKTEKVYNFSVENDETYIAEDLIVHNCRSALQFIEVD